MTTAQESKPGRAKRASAPEMPDLTSDGGGISITTLPQEQAYAVQFGFDRNLVAMMRRIDGAEYSREQEVWMVPAAQAEALIKAAEAMRNEVGNTEQAHADILRKAKAHAFGAQRAAGVPEGVEPMVSDFHGKGEASIGEIVAVNSRYAVQFTGVGQRDGAAFLKIHRLSDLGGAVFAGDHAVIRYNDSGRGSVETFEPQAAKLQRLDESLGRWVDGVRVTEADGEFVIQFDYNPVLASRIGPVVGAEFDKEAKVWRVDVDSRDVVARAVADMRAEVVADRSEQQDLVAFGQTKMAGAVIRPAFQKDGTAHTGEVLAVSSRYVLQHTGKEFMALHRVDALQARVREGHAVRIEYQGGKGTVHDRAASREARGR